jgi:hypothetical protein
MHPRRAILAIGITVLLGHIATPAGAASPSKAFPELARRKTSLGTVSLVVDVLVFEAGKPGESKKVILGESHSLGNQVLDKVVEGMTANGYFVSRKPPLCLGFPGTPDSTLPVASSWEGWEFAGDALPTMSAPFHAVARSARIGV